jgi:hypothetical protein
MISATVFRLLAEGAIRPLRVGNGRRARILVYKDDLAAWIEGNKRGAQS